MTSLATKAFNLCNKELNFEDWKQQLSSKSSTAAFWFTLLELETVLVMHIRTIREGSFKLVVSCLRDISPWIFALDHIHYVRWLTVHVAELLSLEAENREIFESFVNGYFTISKSRRTFSKLAIDQVHEQNNKLVEVDGGAIGILENEAALLKWAVAGLMISDMLETANLFENKPNEVYDHHEDTKLFQDKFYNDKKVFKETLENLGNPFLEQEPQLVHITSKST